MEDSSQGAHGVGVGWDGVGRLCPQLSRQGRDMSLSSLTWVRGTGCRVHWLGKQKNILAFSSEFWNAPGVLRS